MMAALMSKITSSLGPKLHDSMISINSKLNECHHCTFTNLSDVIVVTVKLYEWQKIPTVKSTVKVPLYLNALWT